MKLAKNLTLPNDAVTQTFAILARRGAGKTYTASVMAEEMLEAGWPIVWLDPLGVAWGLRSRYPIAILGGERADVPLEPTGGAVVADFVVRERLPVILDVSEFGENQMRRFVADFADRFYRTNREPIHWFVDEADEFAPEGGKRGQTSVCLGAMQNIVRRGRARGIGVTMITQRSAVLSKSVLTQTEVLIAMQATHPKDLKTIAEWISYHGLAKQEQAELMQTIPRLAQGEAWVYSPGWLRKLERVKIRKRRSHDSSNTPKAGEKRSEPRDLAEVDLAGLTAAMRETIEEAKANDPAELKKRVRELERQLAKQEPVVDEAAVAAAVAQRDREWEGRFAALEQLNGKLLDRLTHIRRLAEANGEAAPVERPATAAAQPAQPRRNRNVGEMSSPKPRREPPTDATGLPRPQFRILRALYWLRGEEATPAKVGFYADYRVGGGAFQNNMSALRSAGLAEGWRITQAGCDLVAPHVEAKPSGEELREWLRGKLNAPQNKILDALIDAGGERLSTEEIAAASGYAAGGGAFQNNLSRLRSIEAAVGYERDGGTRAAEVFFE